MREIDKCFSDIRAVLKNTLSDFYDFRTQVLLPDSNNVKTEEEMQIICDKLDRYCNEIMGRGYKSDSERKNYSEEISSLIEKVIYAIRKIKKDIFANKSQAYTVPLLS